jgi:hypothetical protein
MATRWGVALLRASFFCPVRTRSTNATPSTFGTSSNSCPAAAPIHQRGARTYPQESTLALCHASDPALPMQKVQQMKMRRQLSGDGWSMLR